MQTSSFFRQTALALAIGAFALPVAALDQPPGAARADEHVQQEAPSDPALYLFDMINTTLGHMYENMGLAAAKAIPPLDVEIIRAAIPEPDQTEDVGSMNIYVQAKGRDPRKPRTETSHDYTVFTEASQCGPDTPYDSTSFFRPLRTGDVRGHQCVTIQRTPEGLWKLQSESVAVTPSNELWISYVTEIEIENRPDLSDAMGMEKYGSMLKVADRLTRHIVLVAAEGAPLPLESADDVNAYISDYQRRLATILPEAEFVMTPAQQRSAPD
jgi:hypothetical protein